MSAGELPDASLDSIARQDADKRALITVSGSMPQLPARLREPGLRSLYCRSDGVHGRGAPMTNSSHRDSFHSFERIAPLNRGIRQPEHFAAK